MTRIEKIHNAKKCAVSYSTEGIKKIVMSRFSYSEPPSWHEENGRLYMVTPSGRITNYFLVRDGGRYYLMHSGYRKK